MEIKKHMDMLGHEVQDKVSDFEGIVISISFDLYGCIQALVRSRELQKDGTLKQGIWLDVSRLIVITKKPLMNPSNYDYGIIAKGKKGPANLPSKQ